MMQKDFITLCRRWKQKWASVSESCRSRSGSCWNRCCAIAMANGSGKRMCCGLPSGIGKKPDEGDVPFVVSRVILQDFTGCRCSSIWRRCAMRWRPDRSSMRKRLSRLFRWISSSTILCRSTAQGHPMLICYNLEIEFKRNQGALRVFKLGPAGVQDV